MCDKSLPARPGAGYTLYYGNTFARAPSYELARLVPYLETDNLPQAQLGPQRADPPAPAPKPAKPAASEGLPWLIPSAVALAGAVVALLLYGVLRQAKKFLPPPG